MSKHYDCNTKNIVYILECKKCGDQYIGQTGNSLRGRFLDHLGSARREELNKSTGDHFNLPGHKMSDMQISVLEQVKEANPYYTECRESFHIEQFNLKFKGINRKRWLLANCNSFLKMIFYTFTNTFWYGTVTFYVLSCHDNLLSDDGIVKFLKYIRVIEPSYLLKQWELLHSSFQNHIL